MGIGQRCGTPPRRQRGRGPAWSWSWPDRVMGHHSRGHRARRNSSVNLHARPVSQLARQTTLRRQACERGPRLGPGRRLDRVADGRARRAGGHDRAPTIRVHLGASIEQLEWTVNAYTLSFAVLLMTGAALGDRFGRRRLFVAGLAIVLGRVGRVRAGAERRLADRRPRGSGVRRGAVMPLGMTLLSAAYPAERRARALGIFSGDHRARRARRSGHRWRDHAGNRVAVDLLAERPDRSADHSRRAAPSRRELRAAQRARHSRPRAHHRRGARDRVGARARQLGRLGERRGDRSLAVGALLAVAFVLWERRARAPMLPMAAVRARARSRRATRAIFFLSTALYSAVFFMAQFLQIGSAPRPARRGCPVAAVDGDAVRRRADHGRAISRVGERPFAVAGLLLQAAGMGWIALIAGPDVAYWQLVAPLVHRRLRHLDGDARAPECGRRRGGAGEHRQGLGHVQHAAPARRRVRDRAAGGGVHGRRRLRLAAACSATGSPPRSASRRGCRCSARWPGSGCRSVGWRWCRRSQRSRRRSDATARPGMDARPHGPMDAAAGGP